MSYGKSNDEHSFLYDPLFMMCITINGQLLLTMLIEEITLNIPDCKILMVNTDGFECRFHKKYINIYLEQTQKNISIINVFCYLTIMSFYKLYFKFFK